MAPDLSSAQKTTVEQIFGIARDEYGSVSPLLINLIKDFANLYAGEWPTHEACEVGYHTFGHALDVTLATARMTAGWNKLNPDRKLDETIFLAGMAAAMFHDAGYIKDQGDRQGKGGKFTFNHVQRSIKLAQFYLADRFWPPEIGNLAPRLIATTEFHDSTDWEALLADRPENTMARMVATADLVAQMADVDYLQSIKYLFEEFQEAYEFEGREDLEARGVHVFGSLEEILEGTISFYENFVLPRLQQLGRMDQYLIAYFGEGRNPYLENIAANLSGQLMDKRVHWRRLGDILEELGMVTPPQIQTALSRQRQQLSNQENWQLSPLPKREQLLEWFATPTSCQCLGDILMEMGIIKPTVLREGLLTQLLPPLLLDRLSPKELTFLLRIAVLVPNICKGSWILTQVMEMTIELLGCEAGSLAVATPDGRELAAVVQVGQQNHSQPGRTVPLDKGLAGWVFRHSKPAVLSDVLQDDRYNGEMDSRLGLAVRSLLVVPVLVNGECVGIMEVFNKADDTFTEHDRDLLSMLANLVAVSLDCILRLQPGPATASP